MLHKPDVNTAKILDLANFIEGLDRKQFSMHTFGTFEEPRCICGWLLHNECYMDKSDTWRAAELLGISRETANDLFCNARNYTPKQAASVLRTLAVTGELP